MKNLICAIIGIYLCNVSCSKIDFNGEIGRNDIIKLSAQEYASIAYDNPKVLTQAEILRLVQEFPLIADGEISVKSSSPKINGNYNLVDKYGSISLLKSGPNRGLNIPIYIVDTDNGRAYVSADERHPAVIAYINRDKENKPPILDNPMLSFAEINVIENINHINGLRDSLRVKTLAKVNQLLGKDYNDEIDFEQLKDRLEIETVDELPFVKATPQPNLTGQILGMVGPFVPVDWGQGFPYNGKLPDGSCFTDWISPYMVAGCGPVAGAMVLATVKPINMTVPGDNNTTVNINWSTLTNTRTIDPWFAPSAQWDMVGFFFKAIVYGSNAQISCEETKTYDTDLVNYLRQHINIDNRSSFNVLTCKSSLDAQRVLLASGFRNVEDEDQNPVKIGHNWVVDGYAIIRKIPPGTGQIYQQHNMYLHCNMGWSGASNGWFLVNYNGTVTFEVSTGHYDKDLSIFPNARRKS